MIRPVLEAARRLGPVAGVRRVSPLPVPSMAGAGVWRELPATRGLPDPYGPDPVVFGSVPRVAS